MKYVVILLIATTAAVGVYYYRQQPVTITGTVVCLPHKKTNGPTTKECAYGLKNSQGIYYGLRGNNMPTADFGEDVTVQGTLVASPESTYDIAGFIDTNRKRQ
ncbi:MAG: hypothetical protein NUV52_00190 [Candidatus Roizmanbacteria bacterium]|nr:hypothetical protein [Candidatus Roizmanbacteria bacterium]